MQRLLLVRHAVPVVDPSAPSENWVLSPDGEAAARELGRSLARSVPARIYHSAETKAVRTALLVAEECGVPAEVEEELREVGGRAWAGTPDQYRALAGRYLAGEALDGWEERARAQRRIVGAVRGLVKPGQEPMIVSHGLVLTLFLAWLLDVDADTLVSNWQAMRFPDLCVVDYEAKRVLRPFGQPL